MRTVTIDARPVCTRAGLQRYIQYLFDFSEYYGKNLDALHDMLCEMDRPTHIVLRCGAHEGELAAYLPRLARVLTDAAAENPRLTAEVLE